LTLQNDRRSGSDRRKKTGMNMRLLIGDGARRTIRRRADSGKIFIVDRYSPRLFIVISAILFLCVIDAFLTLFLINRGAYETNPIIAYLYHLGPYIFFIPKYALTILATFSLLMFKSVVIRKINVSTHSLLCLIAWLYIAVVVWELYLVKGVIR
jgi:hypothetical protein